MRNEHVQTDRPESLGDVIDRVLDATSEAQVSIRDVVSSIGHFSYAPLLLVPSIALATPLSGIPLFSTAMGALIFLVSAQMLSMRNHIWLPEFILNLNARSEFIRHAFERVIPFAKWLDTRAHVRLVTLTRKPFIVIPQLLCTLSGLVLPVLEFVPFTSSLIGISVALIAFGMLARDGAFLLLALTPYTAIAAMVTYFVAS